MRRKLVWFVIVVLVAWWGYGHFSDTKKSHGSAIQITQVSVGRQDVPVLLSLPGIVVAYESASIKPQIDSQITAVSVHEGDAVVAGQLLFQLDDRALKAQIKQLEISVQKEKAQLESTRLEYERLQKLKESKAVLPADLENAKAAYRKKFAVFNATQANLESAYAELPYCKITTPIAGRAGAINGRVGSIVKATDTAALVTISGIHPIHVQFAIPQHDYE